MRHINQCIMLISNYKALELLDKGGLQVKKNLTLREALRGILYQEMEQNPDMIMMGESFFNEGTLFSKVISPEFHKTFGKDRILECPVAENGIIGLAFGAALAGMTVVPEIWAADFLFCTANEVLNDFPKWRAQHRYPDPINLVVRAPMGLFTAGGGGPEHSQCPEAYLHNAPGLTIVIPSSVRDAVGLMRSSLKCGDPVIFLEHRQIYDITEEIDLSESFFEPIGKAKIAREGKDITIVAWGLMKVRAMEAANELEKEGISVEIVDPRTIKPMDFDTIEKSVQKTKSLLVVEETPETGSIAGEIITRMLERNNKIKFARLTMPDVLYHYVSRYEFASVPSANDIIDQVKQLF